MIEDIKCIVEKAIDRDQTAHWDPTEDERIELTRGNLPEGMSETRHSSAL